MDNKIRKMIKEIVKRYGVELVGVIGNIQGIEIVIDQNFYYKKQTEMEKELMSLPVNITDITYRDVA